MAPLWVTVILLFAALDSAVPTANRQTRATVSSQLVIHSLVSTSKGIQQAYWFRRLFATELSALELACLKNGTVFHSRSGRCAWLFDQGPCEARQWLVMDAEGIGKGAQQGLRAACRPRPCAPGYGFLADERRCALQRQLCAGDTQRTFRYSLRGEGRCHCKGFRAQGPDGKCQVLYHQGACPQGQMLAVSYSPSLDSHQGQCVRNPCEEGEVRIEKAADATLSHCSTLDELDCTVMTVPLVSTNDTGALVPLCDDPRRNVITVVSRPMRSACEIRDNRGNCVPVVQHTPQPFDWSVEGDDEKDDRIEFPNDSWRR